MRHAVILSVCSQQQDRSQRKIHKFIRLIQQKAGSFSYYLSQSFQVPWSWSIQKGEGRDGKPAPSPPNKPPVYFHEILTQILEIFSQKELQTKACPPQLNVSTFPHSHSLNLFAFYSVVCFITTRETPTQTSYIVYCLKNLSFFLHELTIQFENETFTLYIRG